MITVTHDCDGTTLFGPQLFCCTADPFILWGHQQQKEKYLLHIELYPSSMGFPSSVMESYPSYFLPQYQFQVIDFLPIGMCGLFHIRVFSTPV